MNTIRWKSSARDGAGKILRSAAGLALILVCAGTGCTLEAPAWTTTQTRNEAMGIAPSREAMVWLPDSQETSGPSYYPWVGPPPDAEFTGSPGRMPPHK